MIRLLMLFLPLLYTQHVYATEQRSVQKSPQIAVALSFVPGGGQWYNGYPLKASILFGVGAGLATWRLQERAPAIKEKLSWWLVGLYIYNLIDAYVDAHLVGFTQQIETPIIPLSNSIILNEN